ncbi:MAG TPA: peptide chain release factor 3 [Alphaproteobacteria bacterium]|nr:peptide chain release factor 3 [Alphaproteobacteria bacterium]
MAEPTTELAREVCRRRTFAIISHPDAGKTTLTEKLLLFGGAIQLAGAVKAKREGLRARSDWMAIERQRGISVTASVMTWDYDGLTFNLLDTPGHQDFSEDTYRTLTAVDSAVMVLDAAKGIEAQTLKLFEVCRLRDVPILTFINKLDREARDPLSLIDEIESRLALSATPATWPIGSGRDFKGCYDLFQDRLLRFEDGSNERVGAEIALSGLGDPRLADALDRTTLKRLKADLELVRGACPPFDLKAYREGHLTPVFFGSALKNFGVRELIEALGRLAPPPQPQEAVSRSVEPTEPKVAGFVFKVQANMDPNHRDRIAFVRLCSGRFRRGMKLRHVREGRDIAVHSPVFFLARDRALAEEAVAGDILGIPNHGALRIGDTLTEGEDLRFTGVPSFAPEILRRVRLDDPMRSKHLARALTELAEEGVSHLFKPVTGGAAIVGVVGPLQFEVIEARIETEYKIGCGFEPAPFEYARWVVSEDRPALDRIRREHPSSLAQDQDGALVFLFRNSWELNRTQEDWPSLRFLATREQFGVETAEIR